MKICSYYIIDTKESLREEHADMFECLKRGLELAHELGGIVRFDIFNDLLGKWQILGYFHPDYTLTNSFGERQAWTGERGSYWRKTDLKPYDPFEKGKVGRTQPTNKNFINSGNL